MLTIVLAGPRSVAKRTGSDKPYKDDSDTEHLRFLFRELDVSPGEQFGRTFEEAEKRASEILDLFWEDVVAVALELCRRKTLSGTAVKRMILDTRAHVQSKR